MKQNSFILIAALLLLINFPDKQIYDEIPNQSYNPITLGKTQVYISDFRKYSIHFDSLSINLKDKKYVKKITDYGSSQTVAFYREDSGSVLYIKPEQTKETVQIPAIPIIGMEWYESDSTWKYTVVGIGEKFETPKSIFLNCLVIQSEVTSRNNNSGYYSLYLQYYQRGRGYVGTKVGGLVYSYLSLDE